MTAGQNPDNNWIYELQERGGALSSSAPGLEDIWPRLYGILSHFQKMRLNELAVQEQQLGMVRDGGFLMPSPFQDTVGDLCRHSWFFEDRYFYRFSPQAHEEYFWVSGSIGRGYSLDSIWFPQRGIAVTLYKAGIELTPGCLDRFQNHKLAKENIDSDIAMINAFRCAVIGFPHMTHMLWNVMPALDQLSDMKIPESFKLAVLFEPFGPIEELFPSFAGHLEHIQSNELPKLNKKYEFLVGLGSWFITRRVQDRIRSVLINYVDAEVRSKCQVFRELHETIFWISIKPPKRTIIDQCNMIAGLMHALRQRYQKAGFILDGVSLPWDFMTNTNYPSWSKAGLDRASVNSEEITRNIIELIEPQLRPHVITLNGVPISEEIAWAELATFYIAHGGSMQNKIGWLRSIPGYVHSNKKFLKFCRNFVERGGEMILASEELIVDDDPSSYSPQEMERKDQNYAFRSLEMLVEEVSAAYEKSTQLH